MVYQLGTIPFLLQMRIATAGEIITLGRSPDVINVELFLDLKEDSNQMKETKAKL